MEGGGAAARELLQVLRGGGGGGGGGGARSRPRRLTGPMPMAGVAAGLIAQCRWDRSDPHDDRGRSS